MPRALIAVLVAAVAAVCLPIVTPVGDDLSQWSLPLAYLVATVACGWRAAVYRPERLAWSLAALACGTQVAGSVLWNAVYAGDLTPPFPSVSDWLWVAIAPLMGLTMIVVGRSRSLGLRLASNLDGLICAFTLIAVTAAFAFEPIFDEVTARGAEFGLIPPITDLLVVAIAFVGAAGRSWRPHPVTVFVGLAFVAKAIGDCAYVSRAVGDGYLAGTLVDLPFALSVMFIAFAAWSKPGSSEQMSAWDVRALWTPLVSGLVAVALLVVLLNHDFNAVAEIATALVLGAVVLRLGTAMHAYARLIAKTEGEARTDALTGLQNRRSLFADLAALDTASVIALLDLDGFKAYNDRFGHAAGDELLGTLAARLLSAVEPAGRAYRMGGDEFCVVVPARGSAAAISRAAGALHLESAGITCSWGSVAVPDEAPPGPDALLVADQRMYTVKNSRPTSAGSQLREALVRVLDVREPELHEHVRDVGRLAEDTARSLGLPEHEVVDVLHGAELHDVGKLAIPESILHKPGPLNDEEWVVMRRHTIDGEQLLSGIPALATAASLVRSSHERWDGGGYPDGLVGAAIPMGARIIAVCDAFDAMVTDRPYRRGMPEADAAVELRRCAGSQFDPEVVEAFLGVVGLTDAAPSRPDAAAA
jgi:two-component system cell cycle response regulator